jgi:glycosyltransferase involved in cell wall biosynthesis
LRAAQPTWSLHLLVAGTGPLEARAAALGVKTVTLPFARPIARIGESDIRSKGGRSRFAWRMAMAAAPIGAYVRRLRRAIHDTHPDILHTNGLKMHLLAPLAGARSGLVWHLHDYLSSRSTSARLLRWSRSRCSVILANSRSVADDVEQALSGAKVIPIYNAVDLDRFSPSGERLDLDQLAGLSRPFPDTVRIGLLATFARWKGHATFLNAVARIPRHIPVRAYIIGDALYETEGSQYTRGELSELIHQLGISDRVGFTGFVTRPEAALRALDIVVHASTNPEPFGLVIAEAMASARSVVVSLAGGAAEIVTPGVDSLGHTPGDVEELAARMIELASNPALRETVGRAGRATAERSFDRRRLAQELVPIYQAVIAGHPLADEPSTAVRL